MDHCIQIVEAFRARGLRADFVHSRQRGQANDRVFAALENHELDAIVQSRMLGEGFDDPLLAVAMVGSIFANLGPFVQFVGRVMRSINQIPGHPLNQGVVVFHVGANVARRWNDFRSFSEADQGYFAELLPDLEAVDFTGDTVERVPGGGGSLQPVEILEERGVRAADMQPIGDPNAAALLQQLADLGITPDQAAQELRRLRTTRQDRREARRSLLNRTDPERGWADFRPTRHQSSVAELLIVPAETTIIAWAVAELNRRVNEHVGGRSADRQNFTLDQLEAAHTALPDIVRVLEEELRNGAS